MKQVRVTLDYTFASEKDAIAYYENINYRIGGTECYGIHYRDHFKLCILMPDNGMRVLSNISESLHEGFVFTPNGEYGISKAFIGVEKSVNDFVFEGGALEDAVKSLRDENCNTLVLAGERGIPEYLIIAAAKIKAAMPEINIAVRGKDDNRFDTIVNIM